MTCVDVIIPISVIAHKLRDLYFDPSPVLRTPSPQGARENYLLLTYLPTYFLTHKILPYYHETNELIVLATYHLNVLFVLFPYPHLYATIQLWKNLHIIRL